MFYTKTSDYAHSTLPTQDIPPPSTPIHPHSPIKIVHLPPPTQNISLPPPIHTHPAIKNVHPPRPTQNIPPTPILLESSVQVLKLKSWFLYYIVNEHSTIYSDWVNIPLQTKWLWVRVPSQSYILLLWHKSMCPCNCSCVFAFLQISLSINFGIAKGSDTQDTLLVSQMRKKNVNHLPFVHTELLQT